MKDPNEKNEFKNPDANINPASLVYKSTQYFQYKADSLQQAYSKEGYSKNIQTIIDQISAIPDSRSTPVLNTDKWYAAIGFNIRKPNFIVLHHAAQK